MSELLGRYELVEKIATGGMADVFIALQWGDAAFVREAVIKRLHRHLLEQPHVLDDFCNEAKLLASLQHPGLPAIYDFRETADGDWYIAMEYVRGPTLGALVKRHLSSGSALPLNVALTILVQLCDVLHFIHEREDEQSGAALEIVHGDLTPENIILGRDGRVRLLDFGISGDFEHRQRQREREGSIRGTLGYMAPEAIAGRGALDRRADVFALGVLLYEVTTGRRLFPGDGLAYMNAVLEKTPVRPSEHRPEYPRELERIVLGALERDANQRPASCADLARELRRFSMSEAYELDRDGMLRHVESFFPSRNDRVVDVGTRPSAYNVAVYAPTGRPPGSIPQRSPAPAPAMPSDSDELSEEERDEILRDLLDLAPTDHGLSITELEAEPLGDDLLESLEPPPPPPKPPAPPPAKPASDKAGFYLYVSDDERE